MLRAWATREAAGFMQFPKDVPVTLRRRRRPRPAGAARRARTRAWSSRSSRSRTPGSTNCSATRRERAVLLVLDQVTDPHNVGAILRSAAAFGAIGIVTQDRHSPPESGVVAKAASGALERVPWARVVNLARALEEIGEAGFWRIGLAGDADTDLRDALGPPRDRAGARRGRSRACGRTRASIATRLARLPISDAVESLNVSNAAAVALYAASIA